MLNSPVDNRFKDRLLAHLADGYALYGPVCGEDGVGRLQPIAHWEQLTPEQLPLIPLKKFLLPPSDQLWSLEGDRYAVPPEPPALALVGLLPCDLYGLEYLDRIFAEDALYRRRRERLLVVGVPCVPNEQCFCPPRATPPPFDLLVAAERVWAGSPRGEELLKDLGLQPAEAPEPLPESLLGGSGASPPANLEELFRAGQGLKLWADTARRCLSCGACSAVCPTCYCYDVVDTALPTGRVIRERQWDNCFFRDHALVAGGHNFRHKRRDRLRFRFEHKLLGFGELRGVSSCVGCGRCRRACPVEIDIARVLEELVTGGAS